jgi:hypothetical protein
MAVYSDANKHPNKDYLLSPTGGQGSVKFMIILLHVYENFTDRSPIASTLPSDVHLGLDFCFPRSGAAPAIAALAANAISQRLQTTWTQGGFALAGSGSPQMDTTRP